jgi:hypothetical protein
VDIYLESPFGYECLRVGSEGVVYHTVYILAIRISLERPLIGCTYPKIRDIIAALPGLSVETAVKVYRYETIGPNCVASEHCAVRSLVIIAYCICEISLSTSR